METKWIEQVKMKDIIAVLILVGCFVLLALGIDSFVSATITLIVGYYFGRRIDNIEAKK